MHYLLIASLGAFTLVLGTAHAHAQRTGPTAFSNVSDEDFNRGMNEALVKAKQKAQAECSAKSLEFLKSPSNDSQKRAEVAQVCDKLNDPLKHYPEFLAELSQKMEELERKGEKRGVEQNKEKVAEKPSNSSKRRVAEERQREKTPRREANQQEQASGGGAGFRLGLGPARIGLFGIGIGLGR
jgi:hypothetical protein